MLADRPGGVYALRLDGRDVAEYVWSPELPASTAPRPFLHPVRTLAGLVVTDARPHSHTHQLGISIAAPDIAGLNFWGGRTFVAGHGPAWLDDHGAQEHQRWIRHTDAELAHTVGWVSSNQTTLLDEKRTITANMLGEAAWVLGVHTELTNATERPLPIRSPAALGRPGAGYGGFFWRGPEVTGPVRLLSPVGADVPSIHGRTADWVAAAGADAKSREWTMLFTHADETTARDRWFVRARDYLGVGSSLTWDRPLELAPGATIDRHLLAVVADGTLTADEAAEYASAARSAT
ncbi:oxidoreductase [Glycomyces buryatensis]|uniref:Oxidoreductase n=2 Tax=Glycomyces buryatensis TaxID=2570927 RepID=A0A4S8QBK8_9ACTN|nr:oxidoreductase [Glycomyces buryatensis]